MRFDAAIEVYEILDPSPLFTIDSWLELIYGGFRLSRKTPGRRNIFR